jgi:hypothetical protein
MSKIYLICIILLFASSLFCQIPEWQWAVRAGGTSSDNSYDMVVDSLGNQYIAGSIDGSATFGTITINNGGSYNLFIAKSDVNGNWIWARCLEGVLSASAMGIAIDNDGFLYVTGGFSGTGYFGTTTLISTQNYNNLFLGKLDSNGNWLWAIKTDSATGSNQCGFEVSVSDDGASYVTGVFQDGATSFGSTNLNNNGMGDAFIAKADTYGNWVWAVRAGANGYDNGYSIAVDSADNVFVTGWFNNSVDFGSTNFVSNGVADIFVAKLDSDGNWLWVRRVGGTGDDLALAITLDNENNACLSGQFHNTVVFGTTVLVCSNNNYDCFIAKMNADGIWQWAVKSLGVFGESGNSIDVDTTGNVYVTGSFYDVVFWGPTMLVSMDFDTPDVFVLKLDSLGNWQWAIRGGGSGNDTAEAICINNENDIYIAGTFSGLSIFGNTPIISIGQNDMFLAKLIYPIVSNDDPQTPSMSTELTYNYPNPFTSGTTINYNIKGTSPTRIDIYNAKGQHVKTLVNEIKSDGVYNTIWNGTNSQGNRVPTGVYFYKMTTSHNAVSRKMLLMQ